VLAITKIIKVSYIYSTDFVMELALLGSLLVVTVMSSFSPLLTPPTSQLFGTIWLSMASLVIYYVCSLQYVFQSPFILCLSMFAVATSNELVADNDDCAICWDSMTTERKLSFGHLFHNSCLRSWSEQYTSCPTCHMPRARDVSSGSLPSGAPGPAADPLCRGHH
uniref:Autocrine motility factor receptor a n=1 Tax=Salmo trutta TaxID=8032 RepID=A0A674C0X7_SALTR